MSPETTIDIFRQGLYVAITLVSVLVVPGLMIGLLVAMFQAATQINEMSLSFVPKLLITFMVLVFLSPWMLNFIVNFTRTLILSIPELII